VTPESVLARDDGDLVDCFVAPGVFNIVPLANVVANSRPPFVNRTRNVGEGDPFA